MVTCEQECIETYTFTSVLASVWTKRRIGVMTLEMKSSVSSSELGGKRKLGTDIKKY